MRLDTRGFEINSTTTGMDSTACQGTGISIDGTVKRSGNYSGKISGLTSGALSGWRWEHSAAGVNGPLFYRTYLRVDTLPSANNTIIALPGGVAFAAFRASIRLSSTGTLKLFNGTPAQVGSDSAALNLGQWYRIEIEFNATSGAGAGILKARIDGVEFAASTTQTLSSVTAFAVGGNLIAEAQTQGVWYFDDIAINDNTGSFQTTYPGEGKVIAMFPDSVGDNAVWTRGGADSGANYSQVDENPPNDATDYNTSKTTNQIDDHNLGASGLTSADVINVVHAFIRWAGTAGSANSTILSRIKAGGTVEEGPAVTPNSTTWFTNDRNTSKNPKLTLYDLPGASTTPWTVSDLDTAQLGYKVGSGSTNNVQVSSTWMLVDYTQGAVSPIKQLAALGVG